MAPKFCLQNPYKLVDLFSCSNYCHPDRLNNGKFPGDKSSGCQPGGEFEKRMIGGVVNGEWLLFIFQNSEENYEYYLNN